MRIKNTVQRAFILGLAMWLSGCETVQPWERGHLAKPHAALEPYPLQRSLREHNYNSREASTGGQSANGGGCGCY